MICRRAGFIIQRHNEVRDLEAEMLNMVCYDVEVEPVLQEITGEMLPRGVNKAPDARLDIRARGFWDRQSSAFFEFVTPTQNHIETLAQSKYITNMKMERSTHTQRE